MSTSTSKPSGYHHGDLRGALVAAGLAILEEGGDPAALSLREAARRAGVSAMAPYRHFADKEALLAAVSAVGFERLGAALIEADRLGNGPEGSEADRVTALVEQGVAYVGFACANPALFRLMFGASDSDKPDILAEASEATFTVLAGRVASLFPQATATDWTLHCWALAHGLAALALDGQTQKFGEAPLTLARRVLRLSAIAIADGTGEGGR